MLTIDKITTPIIFFRIKKLAHFITTSSIIKSMQTENTR